MSSAIERSPGGAVSTSTSFRRDAAPRCECDGRAVDLQGTRDDVYRRDGWLSRGQPLDDPDNEPSVVFPPPWFSTRLAGTKIPRRTPLFWSATPIMRGFKTDLALAPRPCQVGGASHLRAVPPCAEVGIM